MANEPAQIPHQLTLDQRKRLTLTGVSEVLGFQEDTVILKTTLGNLAIHGRQLQLKTLSPEGGRVDVEGQVCALVYEEPRSSGGFLRRLFG